MATALTATNRRAYDPSLPLYAAWSLESPIYTCMICVQVEGNEHRVIGSRHWENRPLAYCFNDLLNVFPWRNYSTHVIPPERNYVWQSAFEKFEWYAEQAPEMSDTITPARELLAMTQIDQVKRPWSTDEGNNADLIEALNQYAPRKDPSHGGFVVTPLHNLARFYSRAIELYAAWVHIGNTKGWRSRSLNYSKWDRSVI